MTTPLLSARGLGVTFGNRTVLTDVDLEVSAGEFVAIVGPNGAGKSTLLRALVGLVPHRGSITVGGTYCHHRRHRQLALAYVPQRLDLDDTFPITVGELVASGTRAARGMFRRARTADRADVAGAIARVGLTGRETSSYGALSGGQAQRAILARALVQHPEVLLLDEALSGVDRPGTDALIDLLTTLAADGAAVVVTTHDLALVRARAPRCIALNGRVIADGPPHAVLQGATLDRTFGSVRAA